MEVGCGAKPCGWLSPLLTVLSNGFEFLREDFHVLCRFNNDMTGNKTILSKYDDAIKEEVSLRSEF